MKDFLKKHWIWFAVGGVGLFLFLKSRSAGSAGTEEAPMNDQGPRFPPNSGGSLFGGAPSPAEVAAGGQQQEQTAVQKFMDDLDLTRLKNAANLEDIQAKANERYAIWQGQLSDLTGQTDVANAAAQLTGAQNLAKSAKSAKVACPPGEHLVVTPEQGVHCQPKGGAGLSFAGIGQTLFNGFKTAVAVAAPMVGYQAGVAAGGAFSPAAAAPTGTRQAGTKLTPPRTSIPAGYLGTGGS